MTPPRAPAPVTPAVPERRRLIDFSLPVTWIVGMFISGVGGLLWLGWMAANQNNLLHQVAESQTKSESRVDTLRDQYIELKQTQALQGMRIGTLERDGNKK